MWDNEKKNKTEISKTVLKCTERIVWNVNKKHKLSRLCWFFFAIECVRKTFKSHDTVLPLVFCFLLFSFCVPVSQLVADGRANIAIATIISTSMDAVCKCVYWTWIHLGNHLLLGSPAREWHRLCVCASLCALWISMRERSTSAFKLDGAIKWLVLSICRRSEGT